MKRRPPLHLCMVSFEKGAFGSPSTKVANFTFYFTVGKYSLRIVSSTDGTVDEDRILQTFSNATWFNFMFTT